MPIEKLMEVWEKPGKQGFFLDSHKGRCYKFNTVITLVAAGSSSEVGEFRTQLMEIKR